MIPEKIAEGLKRGKTPFGMHPIYSHPSVGALINEEFTHQIDVANDAARKLGLNIGLNATDEPRSLIAKSGRAFMETHEHIRRAERGHETKLIDLAKRAVTDLQGTTPSQLESLFEDRIEKRELPSTPSDDPLETPKEEKGGPKYWLRKLRREKPNIKLAAWIRKRQTHDLLTQGVAISHLTGGPVLVEAELREIDPQLPELYRLHTSLAQLSNFIHLSMPRGGPPRTHAGRSGMEWKEGMTQANVKATDFPTLVHEMSKSIVEANMAHALPREGELKPDEVEEFNRHTKNRDAEIWQFLLGPAFARRIEAAIRQTDLPVPDAKNQEQAHLHRRVLFSLITERELHSIVPQLISSKLGSHEWKAAVVNLKDALQHAKERFEGGKRWV